MAEFDELNENINRLINELRRKEEFNPNSSLEDISQFGKSYDQYLKSIDTNTKTLNDTLSAYLKNVSFLETVEEEDEDVTTEPVINYGIEQQTFIDYNEELKNITQKLSDLTTVLNDLQTDVKLDIDTDGLEEIKNKLNDPDYKVNIDTESLQEELNNLSDRLAEIKEVTTELSFPQLLDNVNNIKNLLQDLNIEEIDLNIDGKQLDDIISKVSELKNVTINLDIKSNLEEVENTLQQIKEAKSVEINIPTEEIENMINTIDSLNNQLNLEISFGESFNKINELQSSINNIQENFSKINIDTTITPNYDLDKIKNDITNNLSNVDLTIKPKIDIKDELGKLQEDLNLSVNTSLQFATPIIETKLEKLNDIPTDKISDEDSLIKDYIMANTEMMAELKNSIVALNITKEKEVIKETKETEVKKESIAKVEPSEKELSNEQLMKTLISAVNKMVDKQSQILTELKKSNFLKNTDE